MPNRFKNDSPTVPSKIEWDYQDDLVLLPRNVSWQGGDELTIWTDNPKIREYLDDEILVFFWEGEVKFVPDVWAPELKRVLVYLYDHPVGRLEDRDKEIEFFDFLATYDHKIGVSPISYVFEEEGKFGIAAKCDVRPVIRIDWDEVKPRRR